MPKPASNSCSGPPARLQQRSEPSAHTQIEPERTPSGRQPARGALTAGLAIPATLVLLLLVRAHTRLQRSASSVRSAHDATVAAREHTATLLDAAADLVVVVDERLLITAIHGRHTHALFGDAPPIGAPLARFWTRTASASTASSSPRLRSSADDTGDATWRVIDPAGVVREIDVACTHASGGPMIDGVVLAFRIRGANGGDVGRDHLTGLADRVAARQYVADLLADPDRSVALIKFDLDDFRTLTTSSSEAAAGPTSSCR